MSGQPTRALVTVLGLDQHEAGALAVSRMLRDDGFEVVYMGRFTIPETIASVAAQEDVDVVGISAHSWEVLYYAAELVDLLMREDPPIPVVVGGSILTTDDRRRALEAGVADVVLRGATEEDIVGTFRRLAAPEYRQGMARHVAADQLPTARPNQGS